MKELIELTEIFGSFDDFFFKGYYINRNSLNRLGVGVRKNDITYRFKMDEMLSRINVYQRRDFEGTKEGNGGRDTH